MAAIVMEKLRHRALVAVNRSIDHVVDRAVSRAIQQITGEIPDPFDSILLYDVHHLLVEAAELSKEATQFIRRIS